ncbi:MAG: hypothetical protein V8S18_03230 [Lachnospira sp.]|jgi:hypothetical protein|uniref:Lipoprotein n=1 Tax=Lachnospira intestinalis TaxID=3133158 RepID=A0ABV1GST1_9FIRM|nr:hypothetical protein [Lachnospira sp.]
MKRKILLVFSILLLFLISCGQDKNKDVDEQLTEPEYETTSVEAKEIKEGIKVIDGWKVIESEANGKKVYVYAPYIENKLKGVSYWEDSIDVDFNINKIINADMPNGCIATEQKVWSDNVNCSFQPNLGLNEYDSTRVNPKNELRYIRPVKQYYKVLSDNNTDLNQITEYTAPKVDVQAVSFALYEDFLSEVPGLIVKVYGVPVSKWNSEVGDTKMFSYNQMSEFDKKIESGNLTGCDELLSKKISKTGVYYIDYTEIPDNDNYAQYYLVYEFDKSIECIFKISSFMTYTINDSDSYNTWKKENIERLLN